MATFDSSVEESALSETCDKNSLSAVTEETQVQDGSKASGTTLQLDIEYLTGWQLHFITIGICLALFIGQMESSIVSTAVLTITDNLGGYNQSVWIFTAYMLTYSSLLIVWAKLSDIFGRTPLLLVTVFVFIVTSAACKVSQTFIQL